MFNLKYLSIILTLFWSGQSLIASAVDEEQWLVKPSTPPLMWHGEMLKTSLDILAPINPNSFIKKIVVAEYDLNFSNRTPNSFLIKIEFRYDFAQQNKKLIFNFLNSNFNQRRLEAICGLYCCNNYECTDEKDFPDFLKIFYDAEVIPDSVLDIIIPKLQTIDFRLNSEKFITQFKENQWIFKPQKYPFQFGNNLKEMTNIYSPFNSYSIVRKIEIKKFYNDFFKEYNNSFDDLFYIKIKLDSCSKLNKKIIKTFLNSNFNQRRLEAICGLYCCDDYECNDEKNFPDFLKIFYDANVIPDSVLDVVIPKLKTIDFRQNMEKFIK